MQRIYAFFLALLLPLSAAVTAASNDDLAGHYYLRGVMEMAAELLLKNDGSFEAGVAYGSANGYAKGSWSHDAEQLVLHPENNAEVDKDDLSQLFNSMTLLIKPGCLPVVDLGGCFQKAPARTSAQYPLPAPALIKHGAPFEKDLSTHRPYRPHPAGAVCSG